MFSASQNIYKIGMSKDIPARAASIRHANKIPDLAVLHSMHCYDVRSALDTEYVLHWVYREKRITGEWFALDKEDLRHIKKILFGSEVLCKYLPAWYADIKSRPDTHFQGKELIERYKTILDSPSIPRKAIYNHRVELYRQTKELEQRLRELRVELEEANLLYNRLNAFSIPIQDHS